jgi:hypothetical protein
MLRLKAGKRFQFFALQSVRSDCPISPPFLTPRSRLAAARPDRQANVPTLALPPLTVDKTQPARIGPCMGVSHEGVAFPPRSKRPICRILAGFGRIGHFASTDSPW